MVTKRLTEKGVSRIPHTIPGQKQYVIFVQGMPNLILKVGRKTKTFFWDGMTPSGRHQYKLGIFPSTSLDAARDGCIKTAQQIRNRIDPKTADLDQMTGKQLFDEFIDSVMFRDRSDFTVEIQEAYLRNSFLPNYGDMLVKDVHSGHIMDMVDLYVNEGKLGAADHMRCALARLFKYALERRYITLNPVSGTSPPRVCRPRERVLTDDELKSVWSALDEISRQPRQHAIAIRLLMLLPFRGIELIGARWSEIDFKGADWQVPRDRIKTRSSNPRPFLMPLPPLALKLLRELHRFTGDNQYLFPAPKSKDRPIETKIIGRFISRNLTKGIFEDMQHWNKHDLRRTIATNMGKLKVDELVIARCLNHTIRGITTRVYNLHSYRDEKLEALQIWEQHLRDVVGIK